MVSSDHDLTNVMLVQMGVQSQGHLTVITCKLPRFLLVLKLSLFLFFLSFFSRVSFPLSLSFIIEFSIVSLDFTTNYALHGIFHIYASS